MTEVGANTSRKCIRSDISREIPSQTDLGRVSESGAFGKFQVIKLLQYLWQTYHLESSHFVSALLRTETPWWIMTVRLYPSVWAMLKRFNTASSFFHNILVSYPDTPTAELAAKYFPEDVHAYRYIHAWRATCISQLELGIKSACMQVSRDSWMLGHESRMHVISRLERKQYRDTITVGLLTLRESATILLNIFDAQNSILLPAEYLNLARLANPGVSISMSEVIYILKPVLRIVLAPWWVYDVLMNSRSENLRDMLIERATTENKSIAESLIDEYIMIWQARVLSFISANEPIHRFDSIWLEHFIPSNFMDAITYHIRSCAIFGAHTSAIKHYIQDL